MVISDVNSFEKTLSVAFCRRRGASQNETKIDFVCPGISVTSSNVITFPGVVMNGSPGSMSTPFAMLFSSPVKPFFEHVMPLVNGKARDDDKSFCEGKATVSGDDGDSTMFDEMTLLVDVLLLGKVTAWDQ